MKIKTRFSPSPTGLLHIGGVRTALYSWLFARKHKGLFVLRIEDTDSNRIHSVFIKDILFGLNYLGFDWDEGPIYQSNRLKIYQDIISSMLNSGSAYKCYCSKERLEKLRKKQILNKKKPKYDQKCRNHSFFFKKSNMPYVIRFKNPNTGIVEFKDIIRGNIRFSNQELDDMVLQRSNGMPTYNFCVVVDDWKMQITHVIRGEDHINNTPRQINLFRALNAQVPSYAHASMILDDKGKKLSKRNNAISVMDYINRGFVPEAILNYILRLGWSYNDKEIFTINEMKKLFNIQSMSKSSSMINEKKLLWLNNHYLKILPFQQVYTYFSFYVKCKKISLDKTSNIKGLMKNFLHHHDTLQEFLLSYNYFYQDFCFSDINNISFYCSLINIKILKFLRKNFFLLTKWNVKKILSVIKKSILHFKIDFHKIAILLRMSIAGRENTPNISAIVYYMGKQKVLLRIKEFIKYMKEYIKKK